VEVRVLVGVHGGVAVHRLCKLGKGVLPAVLGVLAQRGNHV
jgi:hypothetical protein